MRLYTGESIHQIKLEPWKKDAFEKFAEKISDKGKPFPCIPATQGHQLNRFRYGFVPTPSDASSSEELALLLEIYSKIYRKIGNYTSLIVFYKPSQDLSNTNVVHYEQLFWEQLNRVSELDSFDWPNHLPSNPHDPLWEFCFRGEPYFMYCATPAHKCRMSRQFPYFMLAITPRWVLEEFNSTRSSAAKIKSKIRNRLVNYDTIGIHPELNTYGQEENYEWKQYYLHDDHTTLPQCPFHGKNIDK
jgi:FPC/CPF motif-containing protein YcgG